MIFPTTKGITGEVVKLIIQGLDDEELDLIKQIFDRIVDASRNEYLRSHAAVRHYAPEITIEQLLRF